MKLSIEFFMLNYFFLKYDLKFSNSIHVPILKNFYEGVSNINKDVMVRRTHQYTTVTLQLLSIEKDEVPTHKQPLDVNPK
jgi:hypothetical protein